MNTSYIAYRATRHGIDRRDEYFIIFLALLPFIALGIILGILALTGNLNNSAEVSEMVEETITTLH